MHCSITIFSTLQWFLSVHAEILQWYSMKSKRFATMMTAMHWAASQHLSILASLCPHSLGSRPPVTCSFPLVITSTLPTSGRAHRSLRWHERQLGRRRRLHLKLIARWGCQQTTWLRHGHGQWVTHSFWYFSPYKKDDCKFDLTSCLPEEVITGPQVSCRPHLWDFRLLLVNE